MLKVMNPDQQVAMVTAIRCYCRQFETQLEQQRQVSKKTLERLSPVLSKLSRKSKSITQGIEAKNTLQDIAQSVQETSWGIREVSDVTDGQPASRKEVARMIDESVEQANTVVDKIKDVHSAKEKQAEGVKQINNTVRVIK
ncbi:hypothetical protein [Halorubrum salinum]|uniref:hypothetical protein n=1 Tax=Halorubrum salinum TaxID=767517 RepID=UPI002111A334|nr:hypothetical protein [Halorubrum salinum]